MKIYNQFISKIKDQRGATAVIIAIAITMLMGFVALAVDIGYVATTKNELQNVADSGALAATGYLGNIYTGMTSVQQQSYDCSTATSTNDCDSIIAEAQDVVGSGKNKAGGKDIIINTADVVIGKWNGTALTFTPRNTQPDAVKVTARRDGGANGPITTFFAKIFGFDTVDVKADAIADLSGLSGVPSDGLPIPVGISEYWFDPLHWPEGGFCDQNIKFHPTGDLVGCAGWHVYDSWPSNASKLAGILDGLTDGSFHSPAANAGDSVFVFTGGTVASVFDEMQALYEANKDADDKWETTVVVYGRDDCSNPQNEILIVGFATAIITAVYDSPEKTIEATVICENVEPGHGGGGEFGTMGSVPGLVE